MSYYFDYGATSLKKPKEVADKVYEVLSSAKYANASRGSYYEANNAFREVFEARSDLAIFKLSVELLVKTTLSSSFIPKNFATSLLASKTSRNALFAS